MERPPPGSPWRRGRGDPRKPFRPAIGAAFELDEVPVVEARTRDFIVRVVVGGTAVTALAAGIQGLRTGDFTGLESVWAIAGPIFGAIVAYYFGPQRKAQP